jgi:hypothetical protein
VQLAGDLFPDVAEDFGTLADASRVLVAELLLALSEATSDEILTDERRATVRDLSRRILFTAYGEADLSSPDAMNDTLAQIAACAYIPAPDAVAELVAVQTETLGEQVAVAFPRVIGALEAFGVAVVSSGIERLEHAAADLLLQGRDQIVSFARRLIALSRAVQHALEEASQWAHDKETQLNAAAQALRSGSRRREILDALELEGLRKAQNIARRAPGFDLLNDDGQDLALAVAVGADAARSALGATPGPLLLTLNGVRLRITASVWRHEAGRYRLTHTLDRRNSPLRPGVNVLECAYADSVHKPVRARVLFLVHFSGVIDEAAAEPDGEAITVRAGRLPVELGGWRIYHGDRRAGLKGSLKPGEQLSLSESTVGLRDGASAREDCPPRLTVVDELRRWRGEVVPRRPR